MGPKSSMGASMSEEYRRMGKDASTAVDARFLHSDQPMLVIMHRTTYLGLLMTLQMVSLSELAAPALCWELW